MAEHPLDNPIWNSLVSAHAREAIGGDHARRYAPDVAPFAAVDSPTEEAERQLREIVQVGERICVLGVAPSFLTAWNIVKETDIVQYIWEGDRGGASDEEIVRLTREDYLAMLELTGLVYPAYFRAGTADLGDYFGIKKDGRLGAMAGTRMAMIGFREVSAVCTHPDFRGRGYARRLMDHLISHIEAGGNTPFLHTEEENEAARSLYDSMGFTLRRLIPFWVIERP